MFIRSLIFLINFCQVPLTFVIPLGVSTGLSVRIGSTLPTDVHKAKTIASWCMIFSSVFGLVMAFLLYILQLPVIQIFTNDELVIQVRYNRGTQI